jgi:threonine dehydratase
VTEPVTLDDIRAAAARIAGCVANTPFVQSHTLSAIAGCELFVKFENFQFTASFKERGALNKLLSLTPDERARGVCAMSAGNHAQGVAYHARRLGIAATIVMPAATPVTKVERTRSHGATVVLDGVDLAGATARAAALVAQKDLVFIHPFDDPIVIAGQGVLALEMLEAYPDLEVLVVPIGGGGLIAGMALGAKGVSPSIQVIGVQSAAYPSMHRAFHRSESQLPGGLTVAEGIAVATPGQVTQGLIETYVDDILLVDEAALEHAIALFLDVEKTVSEGAGAAGLAAVLSNPGRFAGRRVGVVLSGGNIDLRVLASVAMRELSRDGRIRRLSIAAPDQPGALSMVAKIIGDEGANILEVLHDRLALDLTAKGAMMEVVIELRDALHGAAVERALERGGFPVAGAVHEPVGA